MCTVCQMGQSNGGFTSAWVICQCKGTWEAQAGMGSQGNTSQLQSSFCCEFKSQCHNFLVYHRGSGLTDDLWRFPWDHWQVCLIRVRTQWKLSEEWLPLCQWNSFLYTSCISQGDCEGNCIKINSWLHWKFQPPTFHVHSQVNVSKNSIKSWDWKSSLYFIIYYGSGCHTYQTSEKMDLVLRLARVKVYAWEKGAASKKTWEVSWDCDHLARSSVPCISLTASFPH